MITIPLAIRDFALPVPRTGSIDAHSGFTRALEEGQEIHLRVQDKRAKQDSSYQAEVKISHEFEREEYRFLVGGRMDGFFDQDPPKIEEIKSSFNIRELIHKLNDYPMSHPYCLQLQTYGYLYWLQNQKLPELTFHLVSTRNHESEDLKVKLNPVEYEKWLELRLSELVKEAKWSEKRSKNRRKMAGKFQFPFDTPRSGQIELIQTLEERLSTPERVLIQAPTGLGKTVGVLYPVLKQALSRGQNVHYVTPKNSQHSVAEDAVTRFRDKGTPLKSLTITAKSKICFKNEPLCNPDYCEYAKDYYTKVYENKLIDLLAKKKKLTSKTFQETGEEFQVCPFQLQLDTVSDADVVICDYNYVFASQTPLSHSHGVNLGLDGKPNLVIDEAHNLPSRGMGYYSPSLSSYILERMRDDIRKLPARFRTDAEELLNECIQMIVLCRPGLQSRSTKIDPPIELFLEVESKLRTFLSRYLDFTIEIQPKDVVLRLCFYWSEFTSALEFVSDPSRSEFFTTYHPHSTGGIVKITCCDASEMLKKCYDEYENVVGFSATLKPFQYYSKLSGLDPEKIKTAEFQSPFSKSNRKLLIIPQVSTKYSDRERNYPKIAEAIQRITALRRGNYFVFFPSFDFLSRTLEVFQCPDGFRVLKQERDMKAFETQEFIDQLREKTSPTLIFAVQGGVFSEGVDYPGEMIIGAFIVGPPLPSFDLEREEMRQYYEKNYGSGFDYAYTFPAMSKAIQAAGRVIRTETDRGLIVLLDGRFLQPSYSQSMPRDWFENDTRELVSNRILTEIAEFWAASESKKVELLE